MKLPASWNPFRSRIARRLLACVAVWIGVASLASAQLVRLPPVIPPASPFAAGSSLIPPFPTGPERVTPATYPSELDQPLVADQPPSATPPPPPGAKPGAFQQLAFAATAIPAGSSGFGITDWLLQATFALPAPTPNSPLVLTPAFQAYYLDGPTDSFLPARLYDASFQFRWLRKLNPCWGIDLSITPGLHGDFEDGTSDAFRLPARALAAYDWSPTAQVIFGVVYLDRDDVNWLPAGGVIWTPSDDLRIDFIFPRPRIAQRFVVDGNTEHWLYLAAEFGGGSYAISDPSGAHDVATLSDYRLIGGVERKVLGGVNTRMEIGYVFNREISYQSNAPEVEPGSTFLVRAGATY